MKLEKGMYVRTDMGDISKIKSIWENERVFFENKVDIDWFTSDSFGISYLKKCKASNNIIDLIEVGDYVNGVEVMEVDLEEKPYLKFVHGISTTDVGLITYMGDSKLYGIKSIVTKEQFENIEYKLDDSNA